nr:hypothetical protein [Thermostichus lividus]
MGLGVPTLGGRSGRAVFSQLFLAEPVAVLLESPASHLTPQARYSICAGRPRRQWVRSLGQVLPTLGQFPQVATVPPEVAHLPFTGGGSVGSAMNWHGKLRCCRPCVQIHCRFP